MEMPKSIVFGLVTFLHDLFTVIWIGGLLTLGLTVMPAARQTLGKGPELKKLMDAIQKRLSILVYVSIAGLLITGLLLSRRSTQFQGLFNFGNSYSAVLSIKHILTLAMIAVTIVRSQTLKGAGPKRERLKGLLLMLNLILGIGVLLLSGFSATVGSGGPP
jgi:uncharacterized membrane protein